MEYQHQGRSEARLGAFEAMAYGIVDTLPYAHRKTILVLVTSRAFLGNATSFAQQLGFRNRQALQRHLETIGLPPWQVLKGWLKALYWCIAWESAEISICERALLDGHNPSGYYRAIEHATGLPWSEIKTRGSVWIMGEFRQQLVSIREQVERQTG